MSVTSFQIQAYTKKDLASFYRCSMKTLNRWLGQIHKDLGPRAGRSYSPKQVRVIVERLGEP